MCAQRDERSDRSLSIGSIGSIDTSEHESFPEVVDSDEEVTPEQRSSDDGERTRTPSFVLTSHASTPSSTASTPPSISSTQASTAPATDVSSPEHSQRQPTQPQQQQNKKEQRKEPQQQQQQQQQKQKQKQTTRRTSRASSNARVTAKTNSTSRRCQLPLPEVVARRAFECTVGARGELSKVVDLVKEGKYAAPEAVGEPVTESEDGSDGTTGHRRRHSHGRPPSSEFRVEAVPHGGDIYVDHQDTSKCLWGVDLHWCDLESFFGLPAELGSSPWDSDEEYEEEHWRSVCVYLDASLNRLRGVDVIADQPSLRELAYLDVSYNLIDDLDTLQDLSHLQVLMASNNQIDSVQALGELPKGSGLRHVDLSNNTISLVEAPQSAHAFRRLKTLNLASNHLDDFEEEAALALTSLERLDVSDNELVSIDWVALLEALRFLDCSANRISVLATFARALADPPRLAEVIAEGNPVTEEPQYRITILTKCKKIKRLDHRPVDAAALKRQLRCAAEGKVLASVRETASEEYQLSVERERSRLERRKSVLKAQERQLDDAFQGYRAQKQREMGECVAYAESLRGEDGQFLTPQVAHVFQEAVEDRRPAKAQAGGSGAAEGRPSDAERSLKTIFRKAVGKERPETRRSSGSSDHDSELSAGGDYHGGRGSDFSHHSSDTERGGTGGSSSTTGSSTRRRRRRRRRPRKTERSQSSCSISAPTSTSDRQESRQERGKGGGSERREVGRGERGQPKRSQTRGNRAAASKKKETGAKEGSDRPSKGAADGATKKTGGGSIVRSVLGAIGLRKTASNSNNNTNTNVSLATAGSAPRKAKR